MYGFDSAQPLSCLGSSVVRASAYIASSVSWVRIPPEQLFFFSEKKRVVWVSCHALLIFIGLRVFMQIAFIFIKLVYIYTIIILQEKYAYIHI